MFENNNFIEVTAHSGRTFKVDISDEACSKFQIPDKNGIYVPAQHGMRVARLGDSLEGCIQGVAPAYITHGNMVLWVKFGSREMGASYYIYPTSVLRI